MDETVGESLQFIDATWPLIVVRLPPVMREARVVQALIDNFERVHARNGRFVVMVDCSAVAKFPGPVERKMLTDWLAGSRLKNKEREHTIGAAVVLTSGPMRAFVSAINWVRRPETPQVWKATPAEALDWCCQQLVEAGLPLTPAIESLRAEHPDALKKRAESRPR